MNTEKGLLDKLLREKVEEDWGKYCDNVSFSFFCTRNSI
jgi:hypothetical protein